MATITSFEIGRETRCSPADVVFESLVTQWRLPDRAQLRTVNNALVRARRRLPCHPQTAQVILSSWSRSS